MTEAVALPDISTKEKAQQALGMDMEQMKAEKKHFLDTVVPEWEKAAEKREASYQ